MTLTNARSIYAAGVFYFWSKFVLVMLKPNRPSARVKYRYFASLFVAIIGLTLTGLTSTGYAQTARTRLTAKEMGLVINTADPYSLAEGEYSAQRRGIPTEQVLRLSLPAKAK